MTKVSEGIEIERNRSDKLLRMKIEDESDTDRLSALPDPLLLHIIESMTTKHRVQTCVLSKRWRNLWKYLTNIKLHHFDRNNGVIFDKFVSQFLSSRDNSIPLHSISYANACMNYSLPLESNNTVIEIMEYAASHDVQQLQINSQTDHMSNLELPLSIFNCSSLTSITLCLWNVSNVYTKMFPKSLNLPALKILKLVCFTFFTGDNGYAEPFSTCNKLSELDIFACRLQDDAEGIHISNSTVSSLAICTFNYPESKIYKVILCTPKLTSLTINLLSPNFLVPSACNLPLLEELKCDCRHGSVMRQEFLIGWLQLIAKVKIMTLDIKLLRMMVNALKNNRSTRIQLPSFVKLKSLKVESYPSLSDEIVRKMVTYLLQNSPPPSTVVISHDRDVTYNKCMFIGYLIEWCQDLHKF